MIAQLLLLLALDGLATFACLLQLALNLGLQLLHALRHSLAYASDLLLLKAGQKSISYVYSYRIYYSVIQLVC